MTTLRTRLMKLEEAGPTRDLSGMSDAEIERFLRRHLGLAPDAFLPDDVLLDVVLAGEARFSDMTHEQALDLLN